PSGLRNYRVIGDVCKEVGEPERIDERILRYRGLKEKYGSYGAIKEGHRDEILSYVFEDNKEAMEIFGVKEQEHLKVAPGTEEALQYLRDQGIERAVVAELKKTLGPVGTDIVTRFLKNKGLLHYFDELVSPQGSVDLRDGSVDLRYKGKTKEEGTLYDELSKDLLKRRIHPSEAVMIGDKLWTDISPAKKRGFKTIQFIGYINYGSSEDADFVISDFRELKEIIKGVRA
ncbi:MAG TPA: HAD family hydrolase, partial [bacterium]|nr:HAD family hydrolase [bacterium]